MLCYANFKRQNVYVYSTHNNLTKYTIIFVMNVYVNISLCEINYCINTNIN